MPHMTVTDLRREAGLWAFERALRRRGFTRVAGADEAGRGAYAGPIAAAAVILPEGKRGRVPGLADSKLLTHAVREEVYAEIVARAVAWSVVVMSCDEIDTIGLHRCNVMRKMHATSVGSLIRAWEALPTNVREQRVPTETRVWLQSGAHSARYAICGQ